MKVALLLTALCASTALAGSALAASPSPFAFSPPVTYESGIITKWVGVADFDEDGNPDLAISEPDSSGVAILFGQGDGTFSARKLLSLQTPPRAGAAFDLNGDGHADLVLATSTGVSVLLGKGDGTFQAEQAFAATATPYALHVADLDEDGKPDLVFPDGNLTVHVLWGSGQGEFSAESTYVTNGDGPDAVVLADLNHDGHLDVAAADYGHAVCCWHVSVLLGHGNRVLGPATRYGASLNPMCIAVGDLDHDGSPDLFNAGDLGQFSVLINRGDGNFDPAGGSSIGTDGLWDATLADLDQDSVLDAVAATTNGVILTRGSGGGQFTQGADTLTMATIPRMVVVSDLDHDTRPDIVTAGSGLFAGNGVTVFLNRTAVVSASSPHVAFTFDAPRPNPARHMVSFGYWLPKDADGALAIFDLAGRLVTTLTSGRLGAGPHQVMWDLRDHSGRSVPAGIYFARLSMGSQHMVRRVEVLP